MKIKNNSQINFVGFDKLPLEIKIPYYPTIKIQDFPIKPKKKLKVWNYKLRHKVPTKKQEQDFIKNLKLSEKQYTVIELKKPDELWNNGNWEGIAYNNIFQRIINYIFKKKDL